MWVTGLKGRRVVTGLAGSGANPEQMEESITETETLADDQGCRESTCMVGGKMILK